MTVRVAATGAATPRNRVAQANRAVLEFAQ
jgi:hypothetical protein